MIALQQAALEKEPEAAAAFGGLVILAKSLSDRYESLATEQEEQDG